MSENAEYTTLNDEQRARLDLIAAQWPRTKFVTEWRGLILDGVVKSSPGRIYSMGEGHQLTLHWGETGKVGLKLYVESEFSPDDIDLTHSPNRTHSSIFVRGTRVLAELTHMGEGDNQLKSVTLPDQDWRYVIATLEETIRALNDGRSKIDAQNRASPAEFSKWILIYQLLGDRIARQLGTPWRHSQDPDVR